MEKINLKVKLYLENEQDKFMGIGVLWLLQKVQECGSLRAAALDLGISYSKAFRMVDNLETSLGTAVISRKKGGMQRSGASLTAFGQEFIVLYDKFQRKCKTLMEKPFEEFTEELKTLMSNHSE